MVPIFLKTKDEVMWFAISKYGEKFLAFPKYYIDDGVRVKGKSYSQWYTDTPKQLETYYTYIKGIGESAFLVDPKDITHYYDPLSRAKDIYDGKSENNEHIQKIKELLQKIQSFFNISIDDIGIDGSSLLGDYKETSDIDILIYGNNNGQILKEKFKLFDVEDEITLFKKGNLETNSDVPNTVYTTGFGQEKEQAQEQFLRRYYGYIGSKRFSIVCVPRENEIGYINLNRDLEKKGVLSEDVLITDDTYSGIVPTIYKVIDSNGNLYSLEMFNHYGINQARTGERFHLRGQVYENKENAERSVIISFWNDIEQNFSLLQREKKQEVIDKLRILELQTDDLKTKKFILNLIEQISTEYEEISKTEAIKHSIKYFKSSGKKRDDNQNPIGILNNILADRKKLEKVKQTKCGLDIYCIKINDDEEDTEKAKPKELNYVTIITLATNKELIAFLPSDRLELEKQIIEENKIVEER